MTRIGINGFGRIGRTAFRAAMARSDVQVVAVNDLLELPHLAYLLKHDSVHGRFPHTLAVTDRAVVVDGRSIRHPAAEFRLVVKQRRGRSRRGDLRLA